MSSVFLRRLVPVLALLALPLSMLFVISEPATASTTCNTGNLSPGYGKQEFCKIVTSHTGADIRGAAWWQFKSHSGGFAVTVYDTVADGKCAWVKITSPPGGVVWDSACGKGEKKGTEGNLNAYIPTYNYGYYAIYVCTGKDSCKKVWEQRVMEPSP
jgi:hypothetical protein